MSNFFTEALSQNFNTRVPYIGGELLERRTFTEWKVATRTLKEQVLIAYLSLWTGDQQTVALRSFRQTISMPLHLAVTLLDAHSVSLLTRPSAELGTHSHYSVNTLTYYFCPYMVSLTLWLPITFQKRNHLKWLIPFGFGFYFDPNYDFTILILDQNLW